MNYNDLKNYLKNDFILIKSGDETDVYQTGYYLKGRLIEFEKDFIKIETHSRLASGSDYLIPGPFGLGYINFLGEAAYFSILITVSKKYIEKIYDNGEDLAIVLKDMPITEPPQGIMFF